MGITVEQQKVIDTVCKPDCSLLKVSACSGSGKTFTLVEIVKALRNIRGSIKGLYIAYNKAIATEASTKFPKEIDCRTTHSLAYGSTVRPFNLTVGYFGYRDIKITGMKYDDKVALVTLIEEFCLSKHTSFNTFLQTLDDEYTANHGIDEQVTSLVDKYGTHGENLLSEMAQGKISCSHSFYLKLYHIMLANNSVHPEKVDILLLDEAGDLNEVTLEIFKHYPADKRVMVGDPNQNIYSFNNTINGFNVLANEGIQLGLTKSFRVDADIARQVECFARDTFDKDMLFYGTRHEDYSIKTSAFISRTNGLLIEKMMYYNKIGTPYNLVRPAKSIFALALTLSSLKKGGFVSNPQYKFLQHDVDDYFKSAALQREFSKPLGYIASIHGNDPAIKTAVNLIHSHGVTALIEAKKTAEMYEKDKRTFPLTLCTSHSSKGLEFDSVEIGDDTNAAIDKILQKPRESWNDKQKEELRLAYVAFTRCKKQLLNVPHLDKYTAEPTIDFAL